MEGVAKQPVRGVVSILLTSLLTQNGGSRGVKSTARLKRRGRHVAHKDFINTYLRTHPCIDCGEADPVVLEFDHVRGEKRCNVSHAMHHLTLVDLFVEVEKCEVRCANCHKRKTAKQHNWAKLSWVKSEVELPLLPRRSQAL